MDIKLLKFVETYKVKTGQRASVAPEQLKIHNQITRGVVKLLEALPFNLFQMLGDYTGQVNHIPFQTMEPGRAALAHWTVTINLAEHKKEMKDQVKQALEQHFKDNVQEDVIVTVN